MISYLLSVILFLSLTVSTQDSVKKMPVKKRMEMNQKMFNPKNDSVFIYQQRKQIEKLDSLIQIKQK